jgi:hypothetical protein
VTRTVISGSPFEQMSCFWISEIQFVAFLSSHEPSLSVISGDEAVSRATALPQRSCGIAYKPRVINGCGVRSS